MIITSTKLCLIHKWPDDHLYQIMFNSRVTRWSFVPTYVVIQTNIYREDFLKKIILSVAIATQKSAYIYMFVLAIVDHVRIMYLKFKRKLSVGDVV